jgi:hypothetical protein
VFFVSVASKGFSFGVSFLFATLAKRSINVAAKELMGRGSGCTSKASVHWHVPKWEEYPHTPGVFVRVANKGVVGYGTWKSVRRMGGRNEV